MASIQNYVEDAEQLIKVILQRNTVAEIEKYYKYQSVVKIQRYFRGYRQRKHFQFLNETATRIQSVIRGYLARKKFVEVLCHRTQHLYASSYNHQAIVIQKHWRGFQVRAKVFSYWKFKAWQRFVKKQNENIRGEMQLKRKQDMEVMHGLIEQEAQQWVMFILFKLHHLISTSCIKGTVLPRVLVPTADLEILLNITVGGTRLEIRSGKPQNID